MELDHAWPSPLGHVYTDEEVEVFRAAGAIEEDPVRGAENALVAERIKDLLLASGNHNSRVQSWFRS
jgi:hypothetical protein